MIDVEHYTYSVSWSGEDEAYLAEAIEFPGLAAHGPTAEKALQAIMDAVYAAITHALDENDPYPSPLTGP